MGLLQRRLSGVLGQVMSDGASFVVVADRGAFSTEEVVDEADLVEAWES